VTDAQQEWLLRPTILPPALRQVEGTRYWEFAEEYRVSLPPPKFPLRLVIPAGWRYDRSSIPPLIPGWLVSRDDLGTLAPAPHDAGYQVRGRFSGEPPPPLMPYVIDEAGAAVPIVVTRATVDEWFLLYLLRQRIPRWRAYGAYGAVRAWWEVREAVGLAERW